MTAAGAAAETKTETISEIVEGLKAKILTPGEKKKTITIIHAAIDAARKAGKQLPKKEYTVADYVGLSMERAMGLNRTLSPAVRKALSEAKAEFQRTLFQTTTAAAAAAAFFKKKPVSRAVIEELARPYLEGPITMSEYTGLNRHLYVLGDYHDYKTTCPKSSLPAHVGLERGEGKGEEGPGRAAAIAAKPPARSSPGRRSSPLSAPPSRKRPRRGEEEATDEPPLPPFQRVGFRFITPEQTIHIRRWIERAIEEQAASGDVVDVFLEDDYVRRKTAAETETSKKEEEEEEEETRLEQSSSYLQDLRNAFRPCLTITKKKCKWAGKARFHYMDIRAQFFEASPKYSSERYDHLISLAISLESFQAQIFTGESSSAKAGEASNVFDKFYMHLMGFLETFMEGQDKLPSRPVLVEQLQTSKWFKRKIAKQLDHVEPPTLRKVFEEALSETLVDYNGIAVALLRIASVPDPYIFDVDYTRKLEAKKKIVMGELFALRPLIQLHQNVLNQSDLYLVSRCFRMWPYKTPAEIEELPLVKARHAPIRRIILYVGDAHAKALDQVLTQLTFLGMRRVARSESKNPHRDFQCLSLSDFTRPYFGSMAPPLTRPSRSSPRRVSEEAAATAAAGPGPPPPPFQLLSRQRYHAAVAAAAATNSNGSVRRRQSLRKKK